LLEALVAMQHSNQFQGFTPAVHTALTVLVCVMWSCVPLISIGMAILDMDMEREKRGMVAQPGTVSPGGFSPVGAPPGMRQPPYAGPQPAATYPSMPGGPGARPAGYGPVSSPPFAPAGR